MDANNIFPYIFNKYDTMGCMIKKKNNSEKHKRLTYREPFYYWCFCFILYVLIRFLPASILRKMNRRMVKPQRLEPP